MTKKIEEIEENILKQEMHEALDERFITYAQMSLEDRALPDARDGLKPSQRRVLYTMYEMGLSHRAATTKSAKICGTCSGNYHPHGEQVVYPTMYRMVQDWILREPLAIGQGNFGNLDGDPPAAMRYSEAKLSQFGDLMLEDLAPDVVPFIPNYDEKLTEPTVLPAKFPNLLVNGCAGIAVGWATSMPSHNLRELTEVVKAYIKNPNITPQEIMAIMPGPDFPTGGKVLGRDDVLEYYSTGHANLKLEGIYKIEKGKKDRIVIHELPYQIGPERVAKEIEQLVESKTIQGISDLKNLSSRKTGIQLVIECQTGANVNVIVNNILKHTSLRSSFSVNQTILVGKKVYSEVNISFLLKVFVEHRVEVLTKKFQSELERNKARIHILDGLIKVASNIDAVIKIIRGSDSAADASAKLIASGHVETEIQAKAVLAITLAQLTKLESQKLTLEREALQERCKWLKKILGHKDEILELIIQEQDELGKKYGNDRRTKITATVKDIDNEDLIKDEDLIVSLTGDGYIRSVPISTFKVQGRGGKGVAGVDADEDIFEIFQARSKSIIFFFTNTGLCYKKKAYEIPQTSRTAKGMHVSNLLDLKENEKVTGCISVDNIKDGYLCMLTQKGLIKRTAIEEYETSLTKAGLTAIKLGEKDEVMFVLKTNGKQDIVIITKQGQCVRYNEDVVQLQGRNTQGSRAMKLAVDDEIAQMLLITPREDCKLMVVTTGGFAKATHASEYKAFDNRQVKGYGVIKRKALENNGLIAGAVAVRDGKSLLILTKKGKVIVVDSAAIRATGRTTKGVMAAKLDDDDEVIKIAAVEKTEEIVGE